MQLYCLTDSACWLKQTYCYMRLVDGRRRSIWIWYETMAQDSQSQIKFSHNRLSN